MTGRTPALTGQYSKDRRATTGEMLNGLCVICAAISATGHGLRDAVVDQARPQLRPHGTLQFMKGKASLKLKSAVEISKYHGLLPL